MFSILAPLDIPSAHTFFCPRNMPRRRILNLIGYPSESAMPGESASEPDFSHKGGVECTSYGFGIHCNDLQQRNCRCRRPIEEQVPRSG
jgi:hypothetical protein